jgi:hypothetical protein
MSHTLHRLAGQDGLQDDYVILVMAASAYNKDETTPEKYKQYLRIMLKHNPANMGGMGIGHLCDSTPDEIIGAIDKVFPNLPMVHGVFATREDLVGALQDIKEADLGLSVIVTGLVDATDCCVKEAGLKRHSINYSLGIWGDTEQLPDEKIQQISSMCGHAMISFNLVKKAVEDIKAGRTTAEEAACELAKPCVCGIFNPARAKRLLEEFL